MNKQQAQQIIRDTFETSFNKNGFTGFIKNLLNKIIEAPLTYQGNYIPDAYKQYIKKLERIGKFSDGENSIDILVITLQKETSLERARTMQRNFIAWYLNGSRGGIMKDAALAAFVSPDEEDWRFSLVKMDYKFEKTKSGRMKVKEEFTPARRWSFLVGANEKSHTAQSRLVNILANDEQAPILKEIENAFDIETVTKEFFLKYRELFLHTKEELDSVVNNDPKIMADFEDKGVDTVNFAKKLLGQIIFLYFLQKKGWFGVGRDDDWGMGSKHFLRALFDKKHSGYKNFYNDILEPLFYEALRVDRSHVDGYYSRFDCKIPFLNGGLFDPIGNYDWVHTDIIIPDKLFSNTVKTREGDTGTGILDVFDRYNFTVKEDEPLEKEVAIDPELLGKSYEKFNAIRPDNYDEFRKALKSGKKGDENKFNKKFGVYYTPREIVHYMCQQNLINYLATEVNQASGLRIPKEDIETLIHTGEHVNENEARVLRKGKETKTYSYKLPESIRNNAGLIDEKLADITVCDPAVGSGAFPVGMMSEIVRARNVLSLYVAQASSLSKPRQDAWVYKFKRRCIEHSLYGVDIDPGAVEIAKLRLWLSLIVDEDDIKNIKPLPNLDYRIMQGNSLISEFMGISFDTNSKNDEKTSVQTSFLKDENEELVGQFQQKKDEFLNESNVTKKLQLKEEIEDLLVKIFEIKLKTQKSDYFNRLKDIENKYSILPNEKQRDEFIKKNKEKLYKEAGYNLESTEKQLREFTSGSQIKPFFLWNLYFSEVFQDKGGPVQRSDSGGGFDVVIANPPYVVTKSFQNAERSLLKRKYNSALYQINLYLLFIEVAFNISRKGGFQSLIVPNSWLVNKTVSKFREFIIGNYTIEKIIDCTKANVFDATVLPIIYLARKIFVPDRLSIELYRYYNHSFKYKTTLNKEEINNDNIFLINYQYNESAKKIISKLRNNTKQLITIANVSFGVKFYQKNKGKPKQTQKIVEDHPFTHNSKVNNCCKKILEGKDIDRFWLHFGGKYIEYGEWLAEPRKADLFEGERILLRRIVGQNGFIATYVESDYCNNSLLHTIKLKDKKYNTKYLLSILNSTLIGYYFLNYFARFEDVFPEVRIHELNSIPIKYIENQKPFIDLVDKILTVTKGEDYLQNQQKHTKVKALEAEIDKLVYKLYNLTPAEIKIVEGGNKNTD